MVQKEEYLNRKGELEILVDEDGNIFTVKPNYINILKKAWRLQRGFPEDAYIDDIITSSDIDNPVDVLFRDTRFMYVRKNNFRTYHKPSEKQIDALVFLKFADLYKGPTLRVVEQKLDVEKDIDIIIENFLNKK